MMRTRTFMIGMVLALFLTGSALAQMGGGMGPGDAHMGSPMPGPMPGPGPNPGPNPGPGIGGGHMGGMGYGMAGAGGMVQGMMGNTLSHGYLEVLNPIGTPEEAWAAVQAFINGSNSSLQISELWEYGTVFKAELSDTKGARAFDLIVDKFTGAIMPEMGMSMMLNASYGKGLYKNSTFGRSLNVTQAQATASAQAFINNNDLGYTLGTPEVYPGYYKFHTTTATDFGMDIMVNGYNGGVWMNTFLGLPLNVYSY